MHTAIDMATVREPPAERNCRYLQTRLSEKAVLHGGEIIRLGHGVLFFDYGLGKELFRKCERKENQQQVSLKRLPTELRFKETSRLQSMMRLAVPLEGQQSSLPHQGAGDFIDV
jgi:hypothetical protein